MDSGRWRKVRRKLSPTNTLRYCAAATALAQCEGLASVTMAASRRTSHSPPLTPHSSLLTFTACSASPSFTLCSGVRMQTISIVCMYTPLQVSDILQPRWCHSATAIQLGPGLTEVTIFGGSPEPATYGSSLKQPKVAATTILQFCECSECMDGKIVSRGN